MPFLVPHLKPGTGVHPHFATHDEPGALGPHRMTGLLTSQLGTLRHLPSALQSRPGAWKSKVHCCSFCAALHSSVDAMSFPSRSAKVGWVVSYSGAATSSTPSAPAAGSHHSATHPGTPHSKPDRWIDGLRFLASTMNQFSYPRSKAVGEWSFSVR